MPFYFVRVYGHNTFQYDVLYTGGWYFFAHRAILTFMTYAGSAIRFFIIALTCSRFPGELLNAMTASRRLTSPGSFSCTMRLRVAESRCARTGLFSLRFLNDVIRFCRSV